MWWVDERKPRIAAGISAPAGVACSPEFGAEAVGVSKRRAVRVLVAGVMAVVSVAALAPTSVAAVDPPPPRMLVPTTTSAPLADGTSGIVIDPGTGRVFIAGTDGLHVYSPSGAPVATLDRDGYLAADQGAIWLRDLAPPGGAAAGTFRIDPSTLAVTSVSSQLSCDPSATPFLTFGMTGANGYLFWFDTEYETLAQKLCRLDEATGTVTALGTPGGVPNALVSNGTTLLSTWGVNAFPGLCVLDSFTAACNSPAAIPASAGRIAISPDSSHAWANDTNSKVDEYDIDGAQITSDSASYPTSGPMFEIEGSSTGLLAISTTTGSGSDLVHTATLHRLGDSTARAMVNIIEQTDITSLGKTPIRRTVTAFSPDGRRFYALVPAPGSTRALATFDLAAVLGAPSPSVVGTVGGASVSLTASADAGPTLSVGGTDVPATAAADGLTFTTPALPPGSAAISTTNDLGLTTASPTPLTVVDLGPFATVDAFVARQYQDFLGLTVTPAQVQVASDMLGSGSTAGDLIAGGEVARHLDTKEAALVRLYQAVFLRPPDTSGFTYWLHRLQTGTRLVRIAASFAGSKEFTHRYGSLSVGAFVDLVYQNVLGRPADASGRAYWIRKLSAGTSRGTLVAQFSQSSEFIRKTTDEVQRVDLTWVMLHHTLTAVQLAAIGSTTTLSQYAQSVLDDPTYAA
jgi:hypothetical protein